MASVLLEHQFHLWDLNSADLGTSREAHRLLASLNVNLVSQELLDRRRSFRLISSDHVAGEICLVTIFILRNEHYVHVDEADLRDILQGQGLHVGQISLVVEHVQAIVGRDGDHIQVLVHGECKCLIVLDKLTHALQGIDLDLLDYTL